MTIVGMRYINAAAVFAIVCTAGALQADPVGVTEDPMPVAKRVSYESQIKFKTNEPSTSASVAPVTVISYSPQSRKLPPGTGTYDVLPDCASPDVRRKSVFVDSGELTYFDILYYNYHDAAQSKQAASWKKPIAPYLEGDLHNPYRDRSTLEQEFGRFFEIRCLPTRVHYVLIEGKRYEEYREGERAWEDTK